MARKYEKRHNIPQRSDVSQSGETKSVSEHIASIVKSLSKLLKPHGPFQKGKTTWYLASLYDSPMELTMERYTGNDLKNPSCWKQTAWNPTVHYNA
jgi:hypothetical protein